MQVTPRARRDGIIAEPLDEDTVVYESQTGTAHRLDPLVAKIWQAADGTRSVTDLARLTGARERAVLVALTQLATDGLLESGATVRRRWVLGRPGAVGSASEPFRAGLA